MRRIFTLLPLLLTFQALLAQTNHFPARQAGWWTLGIDGGLAYQTADVRTAFNGWGAGLTLAKNLGYRPGGALSFDLRGRFLFSRSYGYDLRATQTVARNRAINGSTRLDYLNDLAAPYDSSSIFQNYRNTMGELGLEGVLTFNRLRERTGIVFSLFGGIGLDLYRTKIDQADALGNEYDYTGINTGSSKRSIRADLGLLRDGVFETPADGFGASELKLGLMPGAGFELGYQVGPRFVIGIGHKITFSRTDLLDGQQWTENGTATDHNDWHHYTNLHFRWDLQERRREQQSPIITITDPASDPYMTQSSIENLRATVSNVPNRADIQCTLNGRPQNFYYNKGNLTAVLHLQQGRNVVRIQASTPAGSDEASTTIIWEDRITPPPPPPVVPPPPPVRREPEVRITDPGRSPYSTTRDNIGLTAVVKNIRDKREVRVLLNGAEVPFSMNEDIEASLRLREGRNIARIEVQNSDGRASDEVEIIREQPEPQGQRPSVSFVQPRNRQETVENPAFDMVAQADRVDRKEDISIFLNGKNLRSFIFEQRSGRVSSKLTLQPGRNEILIRVRNRFGEAEANALLNLEDMPPPPPPVIPVVEITEPANNAVLSTENTILRATVKNVAGKDQIIVTLNDVAVRNFEFKNNLLTTPLKLKAGENDIRVQAIMPEGRDEASVRVRYTPPQPKPTVRITEPSVAVAVSDKASYNFRAQTSQVNSRNEITLELNQRSIAFDFSPATGLVTASLPLKSGENAVQIRVSNGGGADQASCTIRYAPPVQPEVKILLPENNTETRVKTANLTAEVKNVGGKSDVSVYLNGKNIDFSWNAATRQVTASLSLSEGANTVRVVAKTGAGSAEASSGVRYIAPQPPKVSILEPRNQAQTTEAGATLKAKVEFVSAASQIQVTHNKRAVRDFSLDKGGNLSASITLAEGVNTLTVEANTPDGRDQASVSITYKAPPPAPAASKPQVTITTPKRSGVTVKAADYTVTAEVRYVDNKSQVKVLINGRAVTDFRFSVGTGVLSIPFTLREGANSVVVEATTRAGTASARTEINYVKEVVSVPRPEIKIASASQPAVSPFNPNEASSQVLATTKHVSQRDQVTFLVNDVPLTNFDFDAATGKLSGIIRLKKGANKVEIKVQTDQGSASDTITVQFN